METISEIKKQYPELVKMTVADILKTKEWKANFEKAVSEYNRAYSMIAAVGTIKRSPFERLRDYNLLNDPVAFANEYSACLDIQSRLPSAIREAIIAFGKGVYMKTIKDLMEYYDRLTGKIQEAEK